MDKNNHKYINATVESRFMSVYTGRSTLNNKKKKNLKNDIA